MPALSSQASRGSFITSVWVLGVFAICILTMRAHLYTQPLDRDLANYAVIAHEWAAGRSLYTDLWLHSPPGIVWTYQLTSVLVGYGPQEMFALGLACALGTLLSIYIAVSAATGSRTGGLWASLLWTLFSGSLPLQCCQPNCESVMLFCLAAAMALLFYVPSKPWQRWVLLALAGAFLAFESLVKQITLPLTIGVVVSLIVWHRPGISRRRAVAEACVLFSVSFFAWLALLLQMKWNGTLHAFWQLNVDFNIAYSQASGSTGMLANVAHLFKRSPSSAKYDRRWLLLLLAITTGIACVYRSNLSGYVRGVLVATAAGSLLAVALPGNYFPHYYQLILPNICVAVGTVAALPMPWTRLRMIALACVALIVGVTNDKYYDLSPNQWAVTEFHDPVDVLCSQLLHDLATLLKPGDTFFEWGDEPQLFFYSNRPPPTGFLFAYTVLADKRFQGPWTDAQTDRAIADLDRTKPALLVIYLPDDPPSTNPKFGAWLRKAFPHPVGTYYDAFSLYRR